MSADDARNALTWENGLIKAFQDAQKAYEITYPPTDVLQEQISQGWEIGNIRRVKYNDDLIDKKKYDDPKFRAVLQEEIDIGEVVSTVMKLKYDKKGPKDWKDSTDVDLAILNNLLSA